MFATTIRTWRATTVAAWVALAIVVAGVSASSASATLNPAGPDGSPYRCCFRFKVEEVGSFGLSFNANAETNQGTWAGEWKWTTIGIYTFLEDSHRRGELYTLAADERDAADEVDKVKDLVYDPSTESRVFVPDNTNHTFGNCERTISLRFHKPGALGGSNIFTFGPIKDVGSDSPQDEGGFGCEPYGPTPGSAGNGIPPQFKPFYGDPFGNTEIPHPAYASFSSGDAIHKLTCKFAAFGTYPPGIATGKAAKELKINVQFFPKSELGRYEKALRSANPPGFHFGSDELPLHSFVADVGDEPGTPFQNPPKSGCHKGD